MVLIGVHSDPDIQQRDATIKELNISYPVCEDRFNDQKQPISALDYKIDGFPTVYVIDKKGKVIATDPTDLEGVIKKALAAS